MQGVWQHATWPFLHDGIGTRGRYCTEFLPPALLILGLSPLPFPVPVPNAAARPSLTALSATHPPIGQDVESGLSADNVTHTCGSGRRGYGPQRATKGHARSRIMIRSGIPEKGRGVCRKRARSKARQRTTVIFLMKKKPGCPQRHTLPTWPRYRWSIWPVMSELLPYICHFWYNACTDQSQGHTNPYCRQI